MKKKKQKTKQKEKSPQPFVFLVQCLERTMQTVKNVLQKCKESGQDPHLPTLCLRSTPLSHDLPSPAKLLNGRVY